MPFVFSGGLTVKKVMCLLSRSPDACRKGRPIVFHVFFCQAEDRGQKGYSAASDMAPPWLFSTMVLSGALPSSPMWTMLPMKHTLSMKVASPLLPALEV